MNTSQDPDYEGPTHHEKRFHKTHFSMSGELRGRVHPKDDPDWEYIGHGRWRRSGPWRLRIKDKKNE